MKKLVLVFSLIHAFYGVLNAQDAVVEIQNMNILYIGGDNPVKIAVPNVSNDKIKVSIDNDGTIQKQLDNMYNVRVVKTGEVNISIEANGKVTKKKFAVRYIPDPTPILTINDAKEGFVSLGKFQSADGIIAKTTNNIWVCTPRASIQSYIVIVISKGSDLKQMNVTGAAFTEEVNNRFKTLKVGDIVCFFEIKARYPGDTVSRNLGSLSYVMQ
jgi:GldM C-terminal domain